MDELLELLNNDCAEDSSELTENQQINDKAHTEGENQRKKRTVSRQDTANRVERKAPARAGQHATSFPSSSNNHGSKLAEAPIDDRLGIRMMNRLVSSNDLSELMNDYTYFSPSVLSAMTLKRLNSLLQDPSQIIDSTTVSGKTESLISVGIVFSNSGTRISSKGGAFCVLTIGNMNSGPCLTIFLFGEAYGKYCCSCKPGKVISLITPKLLPANRGDGSSKGVSFSVYNVDQFKIVANARDFAICKTEGCKNHVDKRVSEFCEHHRRQKKSIGEKQNLNKFQQIKSVHRQASSIMVASATRKRKLIGSNFSSKSNRFLVNQTSVENHSISKSTKSSTNRFQIGGSVSSGGSNGTSVPLQKMLKNPYRSSLAESKSNKIDTTSARNSFTRKPLEKRVANRNGGDDTRTREVAKPKNISCGTDWLEMGKCMTKERGPTHLKGRAGFSLSRFTKTKQNAKTATNTTVAAKNNRSNRLINTTGTAFDGSVIIPKPSKIFQKSSTSEDVVATKRIVTPTISFKSKENLLEKQAEVAKLLQGGRTKRMDATPSNTIPSKSRVRKSSHVQSNEKSKAVDTFLASMGGEIDEEKVRKAKSRFADEIEADEYAKHRRKVEELEKLEVSQELRNKKNKSKNGEGKRLTKTWFCKNCRRNYAMKPRSCFVAQHSVTTKYELNDAMTKEEQRTKLHRKGAKDGGLVLGMGLDWD